MKVLVTGIGGKIGAQVAADLLDAGHEISGFDVTPPAPELRARISMFYGDITDRHAVMKAAEGCETAVHLAALTTPYHSPDKMFHVNAAGTHHVLMAAQAHGMRRVAQASTACVYGFVFATHEVEPQYLPVDENHPQLPQDNYAVSKQSNELMAAAFSRRTGVSTASLRLTTVMKLDGPLPHWLSHALRRDDRRSRELWSYIDMRDTARAFVLALDAPFEGHHAVNIGARDSFATADIRDLVHRHYPQCASCCDTLEANDALLCVRRAEEVLGFVAQHSWRDEPEIQEMLQEAS